MSTKVRYASALAVAVTFITTLLGAEGSGAVAQPFEAALQQQPAMQSLPDHSAAAQVEPVLNPVLADQVEVEVAKPAAKAAVKPASLAVQVADTDGAGELSPELHCLAGAIYFEAKGESLDGQLAVGRVVVARSKSGKFPASYCGVVYQRSQFSFVRGKSMPNIDKSSRSWATAVKMARIAHAGSMKSPAEGALFFHAARVSPGWRLTRVARIDNHVFYR